MSELAADLLATDRVGDDPPPPVVEETPPPAAPVDEDAAFEADLTSQTIEVPDSSAQDGKVKLVPLSAVTTLREKLGTVKGELKSAKEAGAKTGEYEAQIATLQQQLQQAAPVLQAYQAMVQQQAAPPQTTTEDDAEAEAFARNLDLYTHDGKPDIGKAKAILGVVDKRAEQKATASVQPLQQHTVSQQSDLLLSRALNTKTPDGLQPHPDDLRAVWSRLDRSVTATVDGAKQVWIQALGISQLAGRAVRATTTTQQPPAQGTRGADGKFVAKDIPAPLHTEKAGGKDGPESTTFSPEEQRFMKASGMTEKEYRESAASAPWLRGR